jgi:integrase
LYYKQKTKPEQCERNFLTFDEISLLNNTKCKNEDVKRAFLFACYTGLRISDIINIEWNDIKKDRLEFRQQKTNNLNYMPLNETAKNILKQHRGNIYDLQNQKIFKLPTLSLILKYIDEWVKSAGIKKLITTHSGRHTFATLSLTQGVDLYTVSKLLGHCRVEVTQVYAKIVDEKKIEAVNKLPKLNIA